MRNLKRACAIILSLDCFQVRLYWWLHTFILSQVLLCTKYHVFGVFILFYLPFVWENNFCYVPHLLPKKLKRPLVHFFSFWTLLFFDLP